MIFWRNSWNNRWVFSWRNSLRNIWRNKLDRTLQIFLKNALRNFWTHSWKSCGENQPLEDILEQFLRNIRRNFWNILCINISDIPGGVLRKISAQISEGIFDGNCKETVGEISKIIEKCGEILEGFYKIIRKRFSWGILEKVSKWIHARFFLNFRRNSSRNF